MIHLHVLCHQLTGSNYAYTLLRQIFSVPQSGSVPNPHLFKRVPFSNLCGPEQVEASIVRLSNSGRKNTTSRITHVASSSRSIGKKLTVCAVFSLCGGGSIRLRRGGGSVKHQSETVESVSHRTLPTYLSIDRFFIFYFFSSSVQTENAYITNHLPYVQCGEGRWGSEISFLLSRIGFVEIVIK